jgi:uncharacterized membrane-anchored protein
MDFETLHNKTRFSIMLGFLAAITAVLLPQFMGYSLIVLLISLVGAGYSYVDGAKNALENGAKAGVFVIVLIELMVIALATLVSLTATEIFKPTINDFIRYAIMTIGFLVIGAIFGATGAFISRIRKTDEKIVEMPKASKLRNTRTNANPKKRRTKRKRK